MCERVREFNIIIEMVRRFFEDNPEESYYEIPKAMIGSKLDIGSTKTEVICKSISQEFPFIENGRGKLTVNRVNFLEWNRLVGEEKSLEQQNSEIASKYNALTRVIDLTKQLIEKRTEQIKVYETENEKLKSQLEDIDKRLEEKQKVKAELEEKRLKLKGKEKEIEGMVRESERLDKEYEELVNSEKKKEIELEEKRNLLTRRPVRTDVYYDDPLISKIGSSFVHFILWYLILYMLIYQILPFSWSVYTYLIGSAQLNETAVNVSPS